MYVGTLADSISCVSRFLLMSWKNKVPHFSSSSLVIFLGSRDEELPILSLGSLYGATPFQKSVLYVWSLFKSYFLIERLWLRNTCMLGPRFNPQTCVVYLLSFKFRHVTKVWVFRFLVSLIISLLSHSIPMLGSFEYRDLFSVSLALHVNHRFRLCLWQACSFELLLNANFYATTI